MKRFLSLCLCLILLVGLLPTVHAADDISVTINGNRVTFDQPPVLVEGRTLVPVRAVCEALGADVYWYDDYEIVFIVKNDTKLLLTPHENTMFVLHAKDFAELEPILSSDILVEEGPQIQEWVLDVPPKVINGRTLLPIRAVCEALGATVDWDDATQTVLITCPQEIIDDKNRDTNFFDRFVSFITNENEVLFTLLREPYLNNNYTITMKIHGSFENEYAKGIFAADLKNKLAACGIVSDFSTILPNKILFFFGTDDTFDQAALTEILKVKPNLYFKDADGNIVLDNADITRARYDSIEINGIEEPCVTLTLTDAGRTKFAQATAHAAAQIPNGKNYIGIYVDDLCISMPYVAERIDSAECVIPGSFDEQLAKELAAAVNPLNFPEDLSFEFEIQENK